MTELKPQIWETFRDASYYDLWCVRQVGQRKFGEGYHVQSEEEARHLCATLNEYAAPRATGDVGELVKDLEEWAESLRMAFKAGDLGTDEPATRMDQAAARITTLSAEVERLTDTLQRMIDTGDEALAPAWVKRIARAALGAKP